MPGMVDPRSNVKDDVKHGVKSIEQLTKEKREDEKREAEEKLQVIKPFKNFKRACESTLDNEKAAKIAKSGQKSKDDKKKENQGGKEDKSNQVKTQ